MQQIEDFVEESKCLADIVVPLNTDQLLSQTQFKNWTVLDVIGHLHMFNHAAELALDSTEKFQSFFAPMERDLNLGKSLLVSQNHWLREVGNTELVEMWLTGFKGLAQRISNEDPKRRITWAGPDMSVRSFISARQMETWAHGQAIFDLLGLVRADGDRIKNIVHMGVTTFGWTHINRGEEVPSPAPHICLTAPSGAVWEWNEPQVDNRVEGPSVEFSQIVTQTRNVADTNIKTTGNVAGHWMQHAQCFAGPPIAPPVAGTRFMTDH